MPDRYAAYRGGCLIPLAALVLAVLVAVLL